MQPTSPLLSLVMQVIRRPWDAGNTVFTAAATASLGSLLHQFDELLVPLDDDDDVETDRSDVASASLLI